MIRIECFGLSGSGKSTMSGALKVALRRDGRTVCAIEDAREVCWKRRERYILKNSLKRFLVPRWRQRFNTQMSMKELSTAAADHVGFLNTVFSSLSRRKLEPREVRLSVSSVFYTLAEYQLARDYMGQDDILIMDEGFAQRCFTLFGLLQESLPRDEIAAFVNAMPLPDCAFWTDLHPETAELRILDRGKGFPRRWFHRLSRSERVERFRHGRACLEVIAETLAARGVPTERIDNNGSREDAVAAVEAFGRRIGSALHRQS